MKELVIRLESLENTSRPFKRRKIVGRGPGSKRGKTSGRGVKGAGSRSGYKIRAGKEGGQQPLFRKIPCRGFSQERFARRLHAVNLDRIEELYEANETVSLETLREKGVIRGDSYGVKILGNGTLTKKLSFDVEEISSGAREKLKAAGINV